MVLVSAATIWELEIKRALGKLKVTTDLLVGMRRAGFGELAVSIDHAVRAARLPRRHGDPFDRMLVAQAQAEGLTLVTTDRALARYDVAILDARA